MNALRLEGNEAKIEIIPSGGYISQLNDNKVAYFHVYARGWAGTPVEIDTKLRVQDSSNAAGVIIDLVRIAGYYIRQKVGGYKKEADDLLKSPAWIS
jgi:myo-inositol-1-phosphate synthase